MEQHVEIYSRLVGDYCRNDDMACSYIAAILARRQSPCMTAFTTSCVDARLDADNNSPCLQHRSNSTFSKSGMLLKLSRHVAAITKP